MPPTIVVVQHGAAWGSTWSYVVIGIAACLLIITVVTRLARKPTPKPASTLRLTPAPSPGDLVFCHSTGLIGNAIRLGEYLRFRNGDFWNHVCIIDEPDSTDTEPMVIEAVAHGVVRSALSTVAPGGSYEIVPVAGSDAARTVAFARSQLGREYGWLTIASLALQILVPRWLHLPSFRTDRTWICSALGGESIRFGGWLHDWADIYSCVPSELYSAITGISIRELPSISN